MSSIAPMAAAGAEINRLGKPISGPEKRILSVEFARSIRSRFISLI
jgi:hypothetical protein